MKRPLYYFLLLIGAVATTYYVNYVSPPNKPLLAGSMVCSNNTQCPAGNVCDKASGQPSGVCHPDPNTGKAVGPTGVKAPESNASGHCQQDNQCPAGQVCDKGTNDPWGACHPGTKAPTLPAGNAPTITPKPNTSGGTGANTPQPSPQPTPGGGGTGGNVGGNSGNGETKKNCIVTKVGNPPAQANPDPNCQGGGGDSKPGGSGAPNSPSTPSGPGTWPFAGKSPSQFRRIDQGWDLKYNTTTQILAILPGTVYSQKTLSHSSGGGFGPDYPVVKLDTPVAIDVGGQSKTFTHIYYGHVHILPGLEGQHVDGGKPIANTDPNGVGGSDPNWVEVGFDQGTANPVGAGTSYTPEGQAMCDWLNGAKCPKNIGI